MEWILGEVAHRIPLVSLQCSRAVLAIQSQVAGKRNNSFFFETAKEIFLHMHVAATAHEMK